MDKIEKSIEYSNKYKTTNDIVKYGDELLKFRYEKPTSIDDATYGRLLSLGDYFSFKTVAIPKSIQVEGDVGGYIYKGNNNDEDNDFNKDNKTNENNTSNGNNDKNNDNSHKNTDNRDKSKDTKDKGGKHKSDKPKQRQGRGSQGGGGKSNTEHNLRSVQRAIRTFKNLVLTNATYNRFRRHIVLTYEGCMLEWERIAKDFKRFIKQLEKETDKHFSYLYIVEPDDRGSWHIHLILLGNEIDFNLAEDTVYKCWQHGSVCVRKIYDLYGLVQYFNVSYAPIKSGDKPTKAQIKGSRVHFYPPNVRIFRRSVDTVQPKCQEITYGEAMQIIADFRMREATNLYITTESGIYVAHIQTEIYEDSELPDYKTDRIPRDFLIEPEDFSTPKK